MRSVFGSLVVLLAASSSFAFQLPPSHDDAPLRAVRFLDANHGVAAGDHGTVWMTLDGGKTWERMKTGTRASLRAVSFVNPLQGWAVGRTELPGMAGSTGVVLATEDGGLTWTEVGTTPLPGLNAVTFFDEKKGVAVGDGSAAAPSGVFATVDGGVTWAALAGPRATSWTCGHFTNMSNGTLGGVWSRLSEFTRGTLKPAEVELPGGRSVRGMALGGGNGVAVGDGGMILTSNGGKWTAADNGLPADAAMMMDFHCVARFGQVVWAAGRPGSLVLKSTDGGATWERCHTKWNLPIHAITAVSETEVWAVGELGVILKTSDGGKTWAVQRCGGRRAVVLFAHAAGRNLPLDAVATVGGRDGYFAASLCLTSADPTTADPRRCQDEFRVSAAMRAAGGATGECGWVFPMPDDLGDCQPADLLAAWDKRHGGKSEDRLVRQLVLAMRMWSPDVVASDMLANAASPAERLVLSAVQKAFKVADDPSVFPEQIETLGLAVVAPKKLYAMTPAGPDAAVKYDHTTFERNLVNTVQGYAEPAFATLGEGSPPATRCFRLVSHRSPGSEKHGELTQGLELAEGGTARRKLPSFDPSMDEYFAKHKTATASRATLEAVFRGANTGVAAERAMAMTADTLAKLPEDVACRTAVGLGRQLAAEGKWVAARELFLIVTAKYGAFPEAAEAVRWLTRYYASCEARRRADADNLVVLQYTPDAGVKQAGYSTRQAVRISDGESSHLWCKAGLEMGGKLKAFGTAFTRDPATLLSTLSAKRQLGLAGDATAMVNEYYQSVPGVGEMAPGADLWRDCIASERWLQNRSAVPVQPKPFLLCPKVPNKPYLDGKLDDDCWNQIKPVEAKTGAMSGYGTKAHFVYDDDYLYVALECTHPDGKALPKAEVRRRDDDLRGKDRVDLLFDLDRDYQTYYRLRIDQRGCVADDCTGDAGWNPQWFVAVEPTPAGWTAEVAIPRAELIGTGFKTGSTWGVNVTRVVPGLGCQTWSGPAVDSPRPEGMGLMQFHGVMKK
jgi:photosystem II stability/assembly factor-like uncharacterized protein